MNRITALQCLSAAALIGIAAQGLLFRTALGINVPILFIAVLSAGVVIARPVARIDPADLWIPAAALVVSLALAIRTDPGLILLNGVTGLTLLGASMAALAGGQVTRRTLRFITASAFLVMGWVFAGIVRVLPAARPPSGSRPVVQVPPTALPIVRGLLVAIPILFVFGALFASADAVFATLTENLFDWRIDLGQLPERIGIALAVAWLVVGLLAVATGALGIDPVDGGPGKAPAMQSLGAAVAWPDPARPPLRIGTVEALTVLIAVTALFAVFVVLQLAYLFGGLDTLGAAGITYSDYARRGFFELVTVTGLAGSLVLVLHGLTERRTKAFVLTAVVLAALTAVILASAALRLRIYQDAYGWTELRFYVYATMAWFGLLVGGGTALLVRDRLRWLGHLMAISAVAVLIGVNAIGPSRHVADENVARLLNPALVPADGKSGLDIFYAQTLGGDDAVPALVAALGALDGADRASLMLDLEYRWKRLKDPEVAPWPAWNLARERARAALEPLFGS